jgi:hypothetical protein
VKTRRTIDSIAVADINGDNAMDIIVASYSESIEIFFNTGNGTFNARRIINSFNFTAAKVATGDINGDNKIDIIFMSTYSNKIDILYNIDNGSSFDCLKSFLIHSDISYLTIADINDDEKLDIIVGTSDGIVILSFHCHINC